MSQDSEPAEHWLTVYLPEGAVTGRVLRFTDTGLVAHLAQEVPDEHRFRFSLHTRDAVVAGEVRRLAQDGPVCALQFAALTAADRATLAPFLPTD